MQDWIIEMVNQFGYAGIAALIAIENIFPPIPSEVILTFGGFLTTYTSLRIVPVIAASTAGALLGAVVLYGMGRIVGAERLEKWLNSRVGKLLHLKPEDVRSAQTWFCKKGGKTVLLCRFIPIVRSLISIPAGMANMSFLPFLILTAIGSVIWNTALVWFGAAAGASWVSIVIYFGTYAKAAKIVLAGTVLVLVVSFGLGRIQKRKSAETKSNESPFR